nr:CAI-1 autoinducer synthase [Vibrio anguillarum]
GWNANTALLQAVCGPQSNVYIDFFAHMSMWEGARYANANIHPFMHNNCDHLQKLIARHGPGLIVVDSIYS